MNKVLFAVMALVLSACSSQNFTVVRDGSGLYAGKTLLMRTVADVRALAPTDKLSWLEYCNPITTTNVIGVSSTEYAECKSENEIMPIAKSAVSTGYIAGIAGPVLQAGAIVGGAALIGDGIRHSGSTTTNNNSTSGGSSSANNDNTNINRNRNTANGGHGHGHGGDD